MRPILAYYTRPNPLYCLPDRTWRLWDRYEREFYGDYGVCPEEYLTRIMTDTTLITRDDVLDGYQSCLVTDLNWMLRSDVDR